jgi:heat shock protein HslJ
VLRLEAGRLSGSTGCNRVMGAYRLDGDRLSCESRSATTMMACPPPLMAQEQAVLAAFEQAANFGIEEGRLRIADDDGRTLLVLSEYRPVPLLGTDWRLTWYNNGRQAIVTVLQGTDTLLRLHDDGRLEGKACNNYRGTFEVEGDQLRATGPIASTRMACRGPEGADQQEAAYLSALERVAGYRISGDELTLVDDRGSTLARFQAASANAD